MTAAPALCPMTTTQIRAVPVTEAAEGLATCLSTPERDLMARYRHPRRRREFVTGRLALKRALLDTRASAIRIGTADPLPDALLPVARRMRVLPDDNGRPELWIDDDAPVATSVSIAHAAGWAAAACSNQQIGIDIVDTEAPVAIDDGDPWFAGATPAWRARLAALVWGIRECLLKSGAVEAKTVWALNGVDALPVGRAQDIIARWPGVASLASLEVRVDEQTITGGFTALNQSAMLVMLRLPEVPTKRREARPPQ